LQDEWQLNLKERGMAIMSGRKLKSTGFTSKKEKVMPAAVAICCLQCGMPLPPGNDFFCDTTCTSTWRTGRPKSEWNLKDQYGVK